MQAQRHGLQAPVTEVRDRKQETNTLLLLKDTGASGLATKSCPVWKGSEAPGPPCNFSTVYTTHPWESYFVMVLCQRVWTPALMSNDRAVVGVTMVTAQPVLPAWHLPMGSW